MGVKEGERIIVADAFFTSSVQKLFSRMHLNLLIAGYCRYFNLFKR